MLGGEAEAGLSGLRVSYEMYDTLGGARASLTTTIFCAASSSTALVCHVIVESHRQWWQ